MCHTFEQFCLKRMRNFGVFILDILVSQLVEQSNKSYLVLYSCSAQLHGFSAVTCCTSGISLSLNYMFIPYVRLDRSVAPHLCLLKFILSYSCLLASFILYFSWINMQKISSDTQL